MGLHGTYIVLFTSAQCERCVIYTVSSIEVESVVLLYILLVAFVLLTWQNETLVDMHGKHKSCVIHICDD